MSGRGGGGGRGRRRGRRRGRGRSGGGRGQSPAPEAGRGQQASRGGGGGPGGGGGGGGYKQPELTMVKSCEVVGRSFFYQSLRSTQMGLSLSLSLSLSLNADISFEPILVSDYVAKHINKDLTKALSDQDRIKVKKALKGVRVETQHLGHIRRHKISGITTTSTQQLMFTLDGTETQISVAQYFSDKYNVVLQYPSLPAIEAGSDAKPIYLPMELCRIVEGQRYSRKLNDKQVTALLRATCQRPEDRKRLIMKMVNYNNYNQDELVNKENIITMNKDRSTSSNLPTARIVEDEINDGESSFKMISELKTAKDGKFWICGTIFEVKNIGALAYLACKTCLREPKKDDDSFFCSNCESFDVSGRMRYTLKVSIIDDSGSATFNLPDRVCMQLIGKSAEELSVESDGCDMPFEVDLVSGKSALFEINIKIGETKLYDGAYAVTKVNCDHDDIAKYYNTKIESEFKGKEVAGFAKPKSMDGSSGENFNATSSNTNSNTIELVNNC